MAINHHALCNDLAVVKGQISSIQSRLLDISHDYGEEMITPEGVEPEEIDKIGCQVYALLVITEGYKKRMLDWQDTIRAHYGMPVIKRNMDPEYLLKQQREVMQAELENLPLKSEFDKTRMGRFAELRSHDEYEAMSSFVTRKRVQDRT